MRDIYSILEMFSDNDYLNYIEEFDRIKSVLEFCDAGITPLHKVQFRGGNEKLIEEIIKRILRIFKEKHYIDDNYQPNEEYETELRKITLFLALNTDATFKYDLNTDNSIGHLLDITPKLPKCLFVHLIWGLNLNSYFYEILKYTPSWFSLQYCEPTVALIKYLKPFEALETIEGIIKSIFKSICRLELRKVDDVNKKILVNKLYDHIIDILRQFYTPDVEKFSEWSKTKFSKYQGYSIKHLLDIILYCFDAFELPIDHKKIDKKYKIYEICLNLCPCSDNMKAPGYKYSAFIEKNLLKIIVALLNSLQYNIMLITLSTFMYWVEIDLPNNLNLQEVIGENAYKMIDRMMKNDKFQHDVLEQLKTIAIKPKTIQEQVKESTIGDILRKLDTLSTKYNYDEKQIWFDELINRSLALGNDECLNVITSNIELVTIFNCMKLLEFLKMEMDRMQQVNENGNSSSNDNNSRSNNSKSQNDDEDDDDDEMDTDDDVYENCKEIANIIQMSLKNFKIDEIIEIILYRIKLFDKFYIFENVRNEKEKYNQNFNDMLIEYFNKSLENFDVNTFLTLCFNNPHLTWKYFFIDSCTSEKQINNFIKVSESTKTLSSLFIDKLLIELFNDCYNVKFYTNFIYELYKKDLIDKEKFFKEFIYKNINELLNLQQFVPLLKCVKILLAIANKSELLLNAPILVIIGQVIDQLRWDMLTYTDLKDEILRNCIEFIQIVTKKFLPKASEKDKNWIKEKVKSYRPITQYYFQKYSLQPNDKPKHFDKFLHPSDYVDRNDIDEFLTKTYIRCTTKETEWLAKNDQLLPHISNVMLILNGIVSEINDQNAIANYRYCILNYVNIINKFLIPQCSNDKNSSKELIMKILKIIETTPNCIYDEIFMIFYDILLNITQKSLIEIDDKFVNDVKLILKNLKLCKGLELFNEKFSIIITEN